MDVRGTYDGSNGEATKALYDTLLKRGPVGTVAVNLFRACKCSARAKVYRGGIRGKGSFKSMAYERKNWSIAQLCEVLEKESAALSIVYGWKRDDNTPGYEWVLYVDLPHGQVSFHSATRGNGPDYPTDWDGEHKSAERIIAFTESVIAMEPKGDGHAELFAMQS